MPVPLADCLPESVATQVLRLSVSHSALHNSVHAMVTGNYYERSRGHIATPAVFKTCQATRLTCASAMEDGDWARIRHDQALSRLQRGLDGAECHSPQNRYMYRLLPVRGSRGCGCASGHVTGLVTGPLLQGR